jgi:hypothetical protein
MANPDEFPVLAKAAHHVENRKRGTTGLGALLAPDRRIVPIKPAAAAFN